MIKTIIFIEFSVILFCILMILAHRLFSYFRDQQLAKKKDEITKLVIRCVETQKVDVKAFAFHPILLFVLEEFDLRLKGHTWEGVKLAISRAHLLPRARREATSLFWTKREFASRCFALAPDLQDGALILKLLDDQQILVRNSATIAAVRLGIGIEKILKRMSHVTGFSHHFYRDALLQGSEQVLERVEKIAEEERDPTIHLACLEVLSGKYLPIKLPFLRNDLQSENPRIRLAAVKVFAENPQRDSADILMSLVHDPEEEIRVQAIAGIEYVASEKSVEILKNALTDSSWSVRFHAASALKRMGEKGKAVLQKSQTNSKSSEVAGYALQLEA